MAPHVDTAMMEGLSRAYVRAVAVRAGCNYQDQTGQDIGTDAVIDYVDRIAGRRRDTSWRLRLQIKATSQESEHTPSEVMLNIKVDHHRKLIAPSPGVRIVLIVFDMPADVERWLHTEPQHLLMRNCAYWKYLEGEQAVANKAKVQVKIPRTQMFDVEAVRGTLWKIASKQDAISDQRLARQQERAARSLPTVGRRPSP